jgi:signal transduction histidine kinase
MGLALLYDEIEQVNQARQLRRNSCSHDHSRRSMYHEETDVENARLCSSSSSPPSFPDQSNNTCSSAATSTSTTCTEQCSPHCHECDLSNQNELQDLETSLGQWLVLVQEICESADASVEVLNDLLHYDKIQMGSFTMEQTIFPLCSLVEEISKEFRLSARKKNIHFELDNTPMLEAAKKYISPPVFKTLEDFKVVADRIRITQIARNLGE